MEWRLLISSAVQLSARTHQVFLQEKATFSGSQATALTAFRPRLFNVKLSLLVLTSHTVTKPALLPVTKI